MKVADRFDLMRSSNCSTTHFRSPVGGSQNCFRGIDNGYVEGGVAFSLVDQIYTGARIMIANNEMALGQNPVEDFRLCVYDYETHVLRATSDNLAEELNAAPRQPNFPEGGYDFPAEGEGIFIETDDTPAELSLREGEPVILATALYGQYPCRTISHVSEVCMKAMMRRRPPLAFNSKSTVIEAAPPFGYPSGDYESGTPANPTGIPGKLGWEASGNYPSMDLLPFP